MNAIEFENISKQYRLGKIGTGTISHDLNRWWHRVRGKEDPYLKIGQLNDRTQAAAEGDYVWALKDISFNIEQGDVVGIIGRNGAGKSTLLKILSRVTTPSTGFIRSRGRIASLLEVGTGFHPEMSGRENIYMNGSIMGMTRREISRKLDEIVDFSGVAKYIDTPTKRYSSGMTVRLGFAIAAFLEPEILVVDEVLAVGDAEFQKKAIGKMQDVSKGEGRTVIFVSHNMTAVKGLCNSGIYLKNGMFYKSGNISDVVSDYLTEGIEKTTSEKLIDRKDYKGNGRILISKACVYNQGSMPNTVLNTEKAKLDVQLWNKNKVKGDVEIAGKIVNKDDVYIHYFSSKLKSQVYKLAGEEFFNLSVEFEKIPFMPGEYYISLEIKHQGEIVCWISNAVRFTVVDNDFYHSGSIWKNGILMLEQKWL